MAEISHRGMICTKCGFQWEETRGTISACPACQSTFVEAETDWSAIEEAPNPPTKPQPLYREMICTKCGFQWEEPRDTISSCPACQGTFVEAVSLRSKTQPVYHDEENLREAVMADEHGFVGGYDKRRVDLECLDCAHVWVAWEMTAWNSLDTATSTTARLGRRCQKCSSPNVQGPIFERRITIPKEPKSSESPNPPTPPQPLYPPEEENKPKSSESSSPPTEIDEYRPGGGANQYCTSCGNKRSSVDVFCGRCGVRLNELTVQDTQQVERSSLGASNQNISAPQVASPVKRPNPRGIGIRLLSTLLYAFIYWAIGTLVAVIAMIVTGPFPSVWLGALLFIMMLFGGYKGFTKVPKE